MSIEGEQTVVQWNTSFNTIISQSKLHQQYYGVIGCPAMHDSLNSLNHSQNFKERQGYEQSNNVIGSKYSTYHPSSLVVC